jgi:hypothetical protein
MLGIVQAIAYYVGDESARDLLPEVLSCLIEAPADALRLRKFGAMICNLCETDEAILHKIVVKAFEHARRSDRQTAILWTSGLLPVFVAVGVDLAQEAWKKFVQADSVLASY